MISRMMKGLANANLRILTGVLVAAALASAICAQDPQQLQIEIRPNQKIGILARNVSYGEVLRALQGKLGWEIEIPALADELKISYVRVETTQPQDALAKLLEGSKLGYAFLSGVNGSPILKVVVIPSDARETAVIPDAASSAPASDDAKAGDSSPTTQAQGVTTIQPNGPAVVSAPDRPQALSTKSLSDTVNAIGVPPGVSPADVGRRMTFSRLDAAKIMGVPPGVSPNDVGRATTLPISEVAKIIGVPPGVSPSDVGKTIALPLPTGPGERP